MKALNMNAARVNTKPLLTGLGLKIAVIDSGVNVAHPHIITAPHRFSLDQGSFVEDGPACDDPVGHGTAVMAAIQDKAPGADYFALKLFGPDLRASSVQLLRAIEWSVEQRMDIVNLSLGTPNLEYRAAFDALVAEAVRRSVVLVAPRHAGGRPVLPGIVEGVIGVDLDWSLPRDRYRIDRNCLWASGYPRPLPGMPQERNLRGISFAVANATGFVARACERLEARRNDLVRQALEEGF